MRLTAADALFAELARLRPLAATHVLVGRTYRDYAEYERARRELRKALALDPRVRRAHYYLGMVAAIEDLASLDVAIQEFQQELRIAPDDPPTNLSLGLALVMARRYQEALPPLQKAVRWQPPQASAFHFLGRCLVALDRPAEAKPELERALELARRTGREDSQLRNIHYQLGLALRQLGQAESAAVHFAEAERLTARLAEGDRESLDRYLRDAAGPPPALGVPMLDTSGLLRPRRRGAGAAAGPRAHRDHPRELQPGGAPGAGRPLRPGRGGVRAGRGRGSGLPAAAVSLGVAYFNAKQFKKATAPLSRVLAATPADAPVRRMLAVAWLNVEDYAKAAALLADDPGRQSDPQLAVRVRHGARAQRASCRGRGRLLEADRGPRRIARGEPAPRPGQRGAGRLRGGHAGAGACHQGEARHRGGARLARLHRH